jgi:replication factor A1
MGEKTDYFTTQATIAFIKNETFSYPACANPEGCNKKVLDNGDGWLCEKCDRKWDSPIHRYVLTVWHDDHAPAAQTDIWFSYILSLNVLDHTSSFWITAFNEVAEQIMGVSANELMRLKVGSTIRPRAHDAVLSLTRYRRRVMTQSSQSTSKALRPRPGRSR